MKYYIISAAINLALLLIPVATPVLKQKIEEKKEKQTIIVDLKNSVLEENRTKSTVDTNNDEESNGTAGLKRGNTQNKNTVNSESFNTKPNKVKKIQYSKLPKIQPVQPAQSIQLQPQQPLTQPPKVPQDIPPKETPKIASRPIISPTVSTPKSSAQPVISQTASNSTSTKLSKTTGVSNSGVSSNSEHTGHKNRMSNSGTSYGNKNGNTDNGSVRGSRRGRGTGTSGNSASAGNGSDKKSGSTRSGGCHEGTDFSVSYSGHLKAPVAAERLGKTGTVMVRVRFTRGGSVSIVSVTGGNSVLQAAARRAASGIHVNFKTSNCSSGTVTKPFTFN